MNTPAKPATSEAKTRHPTDSNGNKIIYSSLSEATDREKRFRENYEGKHWHKSFDFSNVGRWESPFRKFHQMIIYIQTPVIKSHATYSEGTTVIISSNLPEQISYSFGSSWEAPLASFGTGMTNLLMQTVGSTAAGIIGDEEDRQTFASGINRATTFKIWSKTKPLSLDLKIPVIDDTDNGGATNHEGYNTNLVEALEYLGSLTLPHYSSNNKLGFYTPPPSPLTGSFTIGVGWDDAAKKAKNYKTWKMTTSQYGRVMVQLGGILLIDHCIIEDVTVTYPNTKAMIKHDYKVGNSTLEKFGETGSQYLHPLLAEVRLKISTIEALTADTFSNMLWAREQADQGSFNMTVADESPVLAKAAGLVFGNGD